MPDGLRHDPMAVSTVVGTVLMLAITVSVFSGLSIVILDSVADEPIAPRADLRIFDGGDLLLVQHLRGESVDLEQGRFLINVDGTEQVLPLVDLSSQLGDSWDIGEDVCVSCLYPGQEVLGIMLVYDRFILLDDGVRGDP